MTYARTTHTQHHSSFRAYAWLLFVASWLFTALAYADTAAFVSIKSDPRYQDPAWLEKAWALPSAQKYKATFEYQINPMFCGPATAVNVLKSVGVNKYKQDNVFEPAHVTYMKTMTMGLTLDELGGLIHDSSGWNVQVIRDISLQEFREHLKRANDPNVRYTINFLRASMWGPGSGGGHHSPIAGYFEKEDLVFILDVYDPFKPFLVSAERLFDAAMNTTDSETNKHRGMLRITQ